MPNIPSIFLPSSYAYRCQTFTIANAVGNPRSVHLENTSQLLFLFVKEIQSGPVPLPNDKAIKEKKRKLRETLDRLLLVYVSVIFSVHVCCSQIKFLARNTKYKTILYIPKVN